jgi:hypothetical protein
MNDYPDEVFGDYSDDEVIAYDTNQDGIIDSLVMNMDVDGDGSFDSMIIASDENADGIVDSETTISDVDGDGNIDFSEVLLDSDGDGIFDSGVTLIDTDGDLSPDFFAAVDSSGTIWGDVDSVPDMEHAHKFSSSDSEGESDSFTAGFADYNEIHGSPIEDMGLWEQQDDPMSCAVASTNMMFRTVGLDVDESVTAAIFESRGIYDPEIGTNPAFIDDVINEIAVRGNLDFHAEEVLGFTPESLQEMLDGGVRPLVCVDSSELYDGGDRLLNEMGLIPDTGHAIQVTGIVHNEEGDFVVINDPGFPEGAGQMIPMETFMNASDDFGNSAVAVVDGAPSIEQSDSKWGKMAVAGLSFGAVAMIRSVTSPPASQSNEKR